MELALRTVGDVFSQNIASDSNILTQSFRQVTMEKLKVYEIVSKNNFLDVFLNPFANFFRITGD